MVPCLIASTSHAPSGHRSVAGNGSFAFSWLKEIFKAHHCPLALYRSGYKPKTDHRDPQLQLFNDYPIS
jgi:hypothetical protein